MAGLGQWTWEAVFALGLMVYSVTRGQHITLVFSSGLSIWPEFFAAISNLTVFARDWLVFCILIFILIKQWCGVHVQYTDLE